MGKKLSKQLKRMPRMKGLEGLERDPMPHRSLFPETVDIVTADNIFCGELSGNGNHKRHCLLGLSCVNFGYGDSGENLASIGYVDTDAQKYVDDELRKSVRAFTGDSKLAVYQFNDFTMGNDEKYWIARVWNATMARLGYTEGNPEARAL